MEGSNDNIVGLVPPWIGGIFDHLSPCEFLPSVDRNDGVGIDGAREVIGILKCLGTVEGDGDYFEVHVHRSTRQHRRNFNWENVSRVHHRGKVTMNLLLNEAF